MMVINNMRLIHPGEILREEFVIPLQLSLDTLAADLHVPPSYLTELIAEKNSITADIALRFARYFGTTAQFWINLQTSYDLKLAEKNVGEEIKREVLPFRETIV